jgi:putative sterol carrier protein
MASDLDIVVQFDFRGADAHRAYARISRGTLAVVEGLYDNPDLAVEADGTAWLALVNGEANPTELFSSGDLFVSGNMDLLMRLADLLVGGTGLTVFDAERWRLQVNYLGMLTLDLDRSA